LLQEPRNFITEGQPVIEGRQLVEKTIRELWEDRNAK
jgi:hypothetical protein